MIGYSPLAYALIVLLAAGPQLIGHSSYNYALKYMSATIITVTLLVEPLGATVLAIPILGQVPAPISLAGGALILAGIYLAARGETVTDVEGRKDGSQIRSVVRRRSTVRNFMIKYILFDLDDTLYPTSAGLMTEISQRMSEYMVARIGISPADVDRVRHDYWARYGTTLRGLYLERHIDAQAFLDYVHDIDLDKYLQTDARLDTALAALPQPKSIFTNASAKHARKCSACAGRRSVFQRDLRYQFHRLRKQAGSFCVRQGGARAAGSCS